MVAATISCNGNTIFSCTDS